MNMKIIKETWKLSLNTQNPLKVDPATDTDRRVPRAPNKSCRKATKRKMTAAGCYSLTA